MKINKINSEEQFGSKKDKTSYERPPSEMIKNPKEEKTKNKPKPKKASIKKNNQ